MEELRKTIRKIEKKIENIEARLSMLEDEIKKLKEKRGEKIPKKGYPSIFGKIIDEINRKGYLTYIELSNIDEESREKIENRLEKMGITKLSLGKELFYVHPRVWRDFEEKLPKISERDPLLVIEKLGIAGQLFNELYQRGLLYFDAKEKMWKKT